MLPKPFYRTTDVAYGLIVIVGLDGAVTVEVKEPKGMFGIVVDALRQAATDLAEVSIEAIAAIAKARFGDQIELTGNPRVGRRTFRQHIEHASSEPTARQSLP